MGRLTLNILLSFAQFEREVNRNGLAVMGDVTRATGTAERNTALDRIDRYRPSRRRITIGGDKGFDVEGFVQELRARNVTPHIAIDGHLSKTGKARKTVVDLPHAAPSWVRNQPVLP